MAIPDIDFQSDTAAADAVKALYAFYFETAGNATPAKVRPLIAWLGRVTFEARQEIAKSPGAFIEHAQLRGDMNRWQDRLDAYRATVERLHETGRNEPSPELADTVLIPLVVGFYPGEENRRAPDVSTIIGIVHAAWVTTNAQRAAWRGLLQDLEKNAKALGGGVVDFGAWVKGAIVATAALAAVALYREVR